MKYQVLVNDVWADIEEKDLFEGQRCRLLYLEGDSVEMDYAKPEPELPVFTLSPVVSGHEGKRGEIYDVLETSVINISGATTLPDADYVIMLEVLKGGKQSVRDYGRFPATVVNGQFSVNFKLPAGENYLLSKARLNEALDNLKAGFHIDFEPIEFDSLTVV